MRTRIHPATQPRYAMWAALLLLWLPLLAPAAEPPLELQVRIDRGPDRALRVSLRSAELGIDTAPLPFAPPADSDRDLAELRWYLEQYWRWPIGPDEARAAHLEERLLGIGSGLFARVFGDAEAMRCWQQFRDASPGRPRRLTLDSVDPEVLRLPWELLADEKSHLFALSVSIRRKAHETKQAVAGGFALPVRILVLSPRPKDAGFIDPYTSPSALLDAVEPLGPGLAQVEVLAEPSFAALSRRLRDRGLPPVHVVHFDGHGSYDEKSGQGRLAFEDAHGGLDAVDVDRLGALMSNSRTPLMVLDACESARADGRDPFRSVAPRLIDTGAGSVVAMPYSVLVKTTESFFRGFYQALAQGNSIGQSVDQGRWTLLNEPERFKLHHPDRGEVQVRLKDWFLPVLYQRGPDPVPFEHGAAAPAPGAPAQPRLLGGLPAPESVPAGRAQARWDLERRLRTEPLVLLYGLPGQGQLGLAAQSARWLVRTGRFGRVLYLSFGDGGDRDSAIADLGRALQGEAFAALPKDQRLARLSAALAETRTLILWDRMETLLPGGAQALPPEVLKDLLDLGETLTAGKTDAAPRLLLISDSEQLPHPAYSKPARRLHLDGLPRDESLDLAAALLDERELPRPDREALGRLVERLGGHELAIRLVVPRIHDYGNDPDRVGERFSEMLATFKDADMPAGQRDLLAAWIARII